MQLLPSPASAEATTTVTQDVTSEDPAYNGNLAVSSVAAFSSDGGTAVLRPGTEFEEQFTYTGTDAETLILTGVRREAPGTHPNGSSVAPVEPSSETSPPPGGEAASPSPSPATDDADAPSSPSTTGTDESSPDASADVGSDDSSAAAVGEIPPPCEILGTCEVDPGVGCEGCDELVDQLVGLIETCQINECIAPVNELVGRICGGSDVLSCQTKLTDVLIGAVGEICPAGITTCADPTINMISRLVMDTVCPSGSIGYCAGQVSAEVNEQVAFVVGVARGLIVLACTGDTANHCIQTIQGLLDTWVFQTVCGSSNAFTCVGNLQDAINDAVANTCELNRTVTVETSDSAVTNCVALVLGTAQLVMQTFGGAMTLACGSSDPNACAGNLITKINVEVNRACASIPGDRNTTGVNECIDKTMQIVNGAVETAKVQMRAACGSDNPTVCANNVVNQLLLLVDRVNDLVANTCNQQIGAQAATTDSAVSACVNRALATVAAVQQLVAQKLVEACGSSDPNACAANLVTKINVEVNRVCASIPGDRNTTGVNECIDKTMQIVNGAVETAKVQMRAACGSDNPTVCANNVVNQLLLLVDRVNDLVANTCNQQIGAQTATPDSAVTNCVNRLLGIVALAQGLVNDQLLERCGSTNPLICFANVLGDIDTGVSGICNAVPGSTYETGSNACVDKVIAMVERVLAERCGSAAATECVDEIRKALTGLISDPPICATCTPTPPPTTPLPVPSAGPLPVPSAVPVPPIGAGAPVHLIIDMSNPALVGGRWMIVTTDSPDSVRTEILGTGEVSPEGVVDFGVDLAQRVALDDDLSTVIRAVVVKPAAVPGFGILATSTLGLTKSQILEGGAFHMHPPTLHLARAFDSPKAATEGTRCAACPVSLPRSPGVVEELPDPGTGVAEAPAGETGPDDPAESSSPGAEGTNVESPPEVMPPASECNSSGDCGTAGPPQGAGYRQVECDPHFGYADCVSNYRYIPGVRSFRGWSHRVQGSTSVFEHGSSSRHMKQTGTRTEAGPFQYDGVTSIEEGASTNLTWRKRGDCWNKPHDDRYDTDSCSPDGAQPKYGRDTNRWEEHLVTSCSGMNCHTYSYEATVPYSMDGGTESSPVYRDDGYYAQPRAIRMGEYYGSWSVHEPGTQYDAMLDESKWYSNAFRVKVDFPESYGSGEFVGSMFDETTESTINHMVLRDLPWMKWYYRYDDGRITRNGGGIDQEHWSCQMRRGWTGQPCWQSPQ